MFDNEIKQLAVEAFKSEADLQQELIAQARKFLFDNQEAYVSQWIIQNPYAEIKDYRLMFVYNDESHLGYTVEMEKIENV